MDMKLWTNSQSQSFQESFVLNVLNEKRSGYYVEVGSNHPIILNNTYILESEYGWKGFGFDYSESLTTLYSRVRENQAICCDATYFNFGKFFLENDIPERVDYLQLDIEPSAQTLKALMLMPFHQHKFAVITFEHDLYANKEHLAVQDKAFCFLSEQGYLRVVKNVMSHGNAYEDWYVNPDLVPKQNYMEFLSEEIEDVELFASAVLI